MHDHAHGHGHGTDAGRVLRISLAATMVYIVALLVVGIRANSLALLSEAGHNVSDFLALLLSAIAVVIQKRPPSATKTFGYHRAGVLAAFINALSLAVIAFFIFYEAAERLIYPQDVQPKLMMIAGGVGIVLNGLIAWMLLRTSRDVNIRSALVHEVGDTLSTAAVLIGGWVIAVTGQHWIDSALSFGIGALILWSSFGIVRETLNILLEGVPRGLSHEAVAGEIAKVEGVLDVHDLHVWSIGSETHALSCHVSIADIPLSASERILRSVQQAVAARFHIHHTTIQLEHQVCEVAHGCVMPTHTHPHSHTH